MSEHDDFLQSWLAGLAGYVKDSSQPPAGPVSDRAQGLALRRLLQGLQSQRDQALPALSAHSEQAHWRRVRPTLPAMAGANAQTSPLRAAPPWSDQVAGRLRAAANQPLWAWVAGLCTLAVLLPLAFQSPPDAELATPDEYKGGVVMRGGQAPERLLVPTAGDAQALTDRLEQALRAHQLHYRRLPLPGGGWQIQARVVPGGPGAAALAQAGAVVPASGLLDLQIFVEGVQTTPAAAGRGQP